MSANGARLIVHGVVRTPGDKSISHRALIFAAMARGESRIQHILESADVHATAAALRGKLGEAGMKDDRHETRKKLSLRRQPMPFSALPCVFNRSFMPRGWLL